MPYVYDLVLVGIIIICAAVNYKKGFLSILLGVASWLVALVLAWVVSGMFAGFGNGSVVLAGSSVPTSRPIIFLISFCVISIVMQLVCKALQDVVDKIPLIGTSNHVLGGILGAILGLAGCYILLNIVALVIYASQESLEWMNTELINDTLLAKYLYQYNLLYVAAG